MRGNRRSRRRHLVRDTNLLNQSKKSIQQVLNCVCQYLHLMLIVIGVRAFQCRLLVCARNSGAAVVQVNNWSTCRARSQALTTYAFDVDASDGLQLLRMLTTNALFLLVKKKAMVLHHNVAPNQATCLPLLVTWVTAPCQFVLPKERTHL